MDVRVIMGVRVIMVVIRCAIFVVVETIEVSRVMVGDSNSRGRM